MAGPDSDPSEVRAAFLRDLGPGLHLADLFESLPEVYFYVKDRSGRIVAANRALVALRGKADERELIGRTDFDLHPRHLAERYVAEDRAVMSSGKPVMNQVWLIPDESGGLRWYLSTKTPLFGPDGKAVGLAGTFRDLRKFEAAYRPYRAMDAVLRRVLDGYAGRVEIRELAETAGLSPSQFDRRFKALFGMTPREYLLRVRTDAAAHALATTDRPVGEIALDCGFYDQSSFGKLFRRRVGVTPVEYRRRYAIEASRGDQMEAGSTMMAASGYDPPGGE
jgi:PAS domain S-box-containing protein